MLEVVFSDSVAGAMLMAIGHQHIVGSANAVIVTNKGREQDAAIPQAEIKKFQREAEERERRGWENAVPFERWPLMFLSPVSVPSQEHRTHYR